VHHLLSEQGLASASALQERVLREPGVMLRLLGHLTVPTTTMFRDPGFFRAFRETVVPRLRPLPFLRVWHAGCSTGEEVYSLAILLTEAGLYERTRVYATDIHPQVVEQARSGIVGLERMPEYASNYAQAGGTARLWDYFVVSHQHAIFRASLRRNLVFARHDLVGDGAFNAFDVILCRNVLIYFGAALQARVHRLLHASLRHAGVLALGRSETLQHTVLEAQYAPLHPHEALYCKQG
jgi:chemotaxis protein methyltransferase CheR